MPAGQRITMPKIAETSVPAWTDVSALDFRETCIIFGFMDRTVGCPVRPDVAEGMEVLTVDRRPLGFVRGFREKEFLLCDAGAPVTLVPYTAIESVSPSQVILQTKGTTAWDIVEATPLPSSPLER